MTTHFLRTQNNKTIAEIEAYENDLSCVVDIRQYTEFLLFGINKNDRTEFAIDMDTLQEIRGEYFEDFKTIIPPGRLAKERIKGMAKKWGLFYVVD